MKTVLFVPGFQEDLHTRDYKALLEAMEAKGYKTNFVEINWKRTLPEDWVGQLDAEYSKYEPSETILAGFSYGAVTAFLSASKISPAQLWLFSLSPYFSEDIPDMKKSWLRSIGKQRTESFSKLYFTQYAVNIRCKTLLFYGELEAAKYPLIGRRSKIAHQTFKQSTLIQVPGSPHDVTNQAYIAAIVENI